jgi:hypothetical protein
MALAARLCVRLEVCLTPLVLIRSTTASPTNSSTMRATTCSTLIATGRHVWNFSVMSLVVSSWTRRVAPVCTPRNLTRGAHMSSVSTRALGMVELCRQRVPTGQFRVHDLAQSLDWLPDASTDRVLFALALEYIDDRTSALRELRRVLKPDGVLVMSRPHPTGDWLRHGGNYFDARVIEEIWSRGWHVRYWLAPLEQTCEELRAAGFLIESVGTEANCRGGRSRSRRLRASLLRTDRVHDDQGDTRPSETLTSRI